MQVQDKKVLQFANKATEMCCTFGKNITVPVPTLKAIGSQSSGKSSLLRKFIGYDVLPTGDSMVTRTPIYVRMHNCQENTVKITLSHLKLGASEIKKVVEFSPDDKDKNTKLQQFKRSVEELTDEITIGKYTISKTPIFIDIESKTVSNFSFVDLPGIIQSALVDKGQAHDLPEKIKELLKEELSVPNTIALVVIKTGNDLETDSGVALINEINNAKKSTLGVGRSFGTIGVLTKPDMISDLVVRNNLNNLVAGRMINKDEPLSSSLTMSEGFFVVNNNCQNSKEEQEYFLNNFDQSREIVSEKRFSVENLQLYLQSLLAEEIRKLMPSIKANLSDILKSQRQKAQYLGTELKSDQEKVGYYMTTITQINRLLRESIDACGSQQNIGARIGSVQDVFLEKINALDPFSLKNVPDEYFESIISSFNSFHMTTQVTVGHLATRCVQDESKKPVTLIFPIAEEFVNAIVSILNDNIKQLLDSEEITNISSYPKLKSKISQALTGKVKAYGKNVLDEIRDDLITHGSHFWSTDPEFKKTLDENFLPRPPTQEEEKKPDSRIGITIASSVKTSYRKPTYGKMSSVQYSYKPIQIRTLLSKYYETIVASVRDFFVKLIIRKTVRELESKIFDELNLLQNDQEDKITKYISETESCSTKRATINNTIEKLERAVELANNYE